MAITVITLTTDFGLGGPYVGAVRGVLLREHPGAILADISHTVAPQDVAGGAFVLAAATPWFPPGTVHLAVVDPGVGSARRALVVTAGGHIYVGPDNGLFTLALDRDPAAVVRVIDLKRVGLPEPSATFHGRDLFAPVAARLALGRLRPQDVGPIVDAPVRLPVEPPRRAGAMLAVAVLHVDTFGNVTTNLARGSAAAEGLGPAGIVLEPGGRTLRLVTTYADAPDDGPVALWGSSGYLEFAVNRGRADAALGLAAGDHVTLRVS